MDKPIDEILKEITDAGYELLLGTNGYTTVSEYQYQLWLKGMLPVADKGLKGEDAVRSVYKNWKHLRSMRAEYV